MALNYKDNTKGQIDMRGKRAEIALKHRKQKREEHLLKNRNITMDDAKKKISKSTTKSQKLEFEAVSKYKKIGKSQDEMRLKRTEATVELRKQKREENMNQARNVTDLVQRFTVEEIVRLASNASNRENRLKAVEEARKVLSSDQHKDIADLVDQNILKILVECLQFDDEPMLQYEASLALGNFAARASEHRKQVIICGAVPPSIRLLLSKDLTVCQQSVLTLSNVIANEPSLLKYVLIKGFLGPFLSLVQKNTPTSLLKQLTQLLTQLCDMHKYVQSFYTADAILKTLYGLLDHTDETLLLKTVRAISLLVKGGDDEIQMVIDNGIIPKLTPLLEHTNNSIKDMALLALGHALLGSEEQAQFVLDHQALAYFPDLLSNPETKIRRSATWFLLNVTGGNDIQVQAVIQAGLLPKLIEALKDSDFLVQRSALYSIYNFAIEGTDNQVLNLVNEGVIPPVCNMLSYRDQELNHLALKSLEAILKISDSRVPELVEIIEECDGCKDIEKLVYSENSVISNLAESIFEKYISKESEEPFSQNYHF